MSRRSRSSGHWRRQQSGDAFVSRASREGWRSRAVYKLKQIDARGRLFRNGMVCVDLGACPGGWSQFAAGKVGSAGRVLAVDLQPMDPIRGVDFLQGDFTEAAIREQVVAALDGSSADLVMSDMAPNITGHREVDQPRAMHLAEEALEFACDVLERKGSFLVKLFQGEGFEAFVVRTRQRFGRGANHQAEGLEAGKAVKCTCWRETMGCSSVRNMRRLRYSAGIPKGVRV